MKKMLCLPLLVLILAAGSGSAYQNQPTLRDTISDKISSVRQRSQDQGVKSSRAEEKILNLDEEQPRYFYSQPQVIYEVVENPLYSKCGGNKKCKQGESIYMADDEQPRFFYSNPKISYQCEENPLFSSMASQESCQKEEEAQQKQKSDRFCAQIQSLQTEVGLLKCQLREIQCQEPPCPPEVCYKCPIKPTPCRRVPFFSKFQVWADALYWHPLFDGVEYATVIGSPSKVVEVMPHFTWGYKVGGRIYTNCDSYFVESEYYHYEQKGFSSVTAPGAISTFFNVPLAPLADAATGEIMSEYQAVDISTGFQWLSSNCWKSYLFGGARYVCIGEMEFFTYDDGGVITPAFQQYGIDGWGPRLGGSFTLFPFSKKMYLSNLGVFGQVAVTGMIATARLTVNSSTNVFAPEGKLVFPPGDEFILGVDLKLEAFYVFCIRSFEVNVRGGYELHSYQNARQRLTSSNSIGTEPKTISANGYGGPYVGLSLSY